jgi:hypothetical protein
MDARKNGMREVRATAIDLCAGDLVINQQTGAVRGTVVSTPQLTGDGRGVLLDLRNEATKHTERVTWPVGRTVRILVRWRAS